MTLREFSAARFFLFILFPCLLAATPAATAVPAVLRETPPQSRIVLTTREGLAGNFVTALARQNNSTLWIGTTTGLTRVQGDRWTVFTATHGMGDDWVTCLAPGPDGRLWIGTQSGGLSVFDGQSFQNYTVSNSAIPGNFVTAVAVDSAGAVWVGTLYRGMTRLTTGSPDRWERFPLADNSITTLAVDAEGAVWAGTDGSGAFRFDGNRWVPAGVPGSGRVPQITLDGSRLNVVTRDGAFELEDGLWKPVVLQAQADAAAELGVDLKQVSAFMQDGSRTLVGTARGLGVITPGADAEINTPRPLPVLLVHGWTVAESDQFQDSEFRFFKTYAEQDGIPVYYAQGVSPKNTLFQNAEQIGRDVAQVKSETGADKVNIIAFSMGGLNSRAYLESSFYQHDVNRVIILGTPMAGVDLWKPILFQQILDKPDEPSAIELTPEYARLFQATHAPRAGVPYDLLAGDARGQPLLQFIADMPRNDGLIGVDSALALSGPNVRQTVSTDLHAYDPAPVPFSLTSYLYPRDSYERYLRNALRDPSNAPVGSEVRGEGPAPAQPDKIKINHTPVVTGSLSAGQTITRTVVLDANRQARFIAYYPSGDIDFSIRSPDGRLTRATDASLADQALGRGDVGAASMKADIANFTGYAVKNAQPGTWSLILKRTDKGSEPLEVTTYVDLDADQRVDAAAVIQPADGSIAIHATLARPAQPVTVTARISIPSLPPGGAYTFTTLPLAAKANGYSALFKPPHPGYYPIRIDLARDALQRESEVLVAVNPGGARLDRAANVDITRTQDGRIERIEIAARVTADRAGAYALSAGLRDGSGRPAARVTTAVQLQAGENTVELALAREDLAYPGPYSLDLVLLDASWAGIEIDGVKDVAVIEP
ncbi:MAG: alpha/beta fold hydrolase [Rudaea sp.]